MITPIYASLIGLLLIGLSINVIKGRRQLGVGLGDANYLEMKRRIRAQANLAEYAPLFLILLGYMEHGSAAPYWAVHLFGLIFLAGRIMHAYSLLKIEQYNQDKLTTIPKWRIRGMVCTFISIGFLSIFIGIKNIFFILTLLYCNKFSHNLLTTIHCSCCWFNKTKNFWKN